MAFLIHVRISFVFGDIIFPFLVELFQFLPKHFINYDLTKSLNDLPIDKSIG